VPQEICLRALILVFLALAQDLVRIGFRSRSEIIAENLFLRRQLALYQERKTRRRPTAATKLAVVIVSRFFSWNGALAIVRPSTYTEVNCRYRPSWYRCHRSAPWKIFAAYVLVA
jgi:hypothetical protein